MEKDKERAAVCQLADRRPLYLLHATSLTWVVPPEDAIDVTEDQWTKLALSFFQVDWNPQLVVMSSMAVLHCVHVCPPGSFLIRLISS